MADLVVPGYDVVELLGFGSGGEVWLARERATGAPVALKRLHAGADLDARDRLRREAAVLAGVDHPHVLRLRAVVGSGESLVLVLDLATGGSLARLLATRGRLAPGEVVTVAVPLAQALAVVHAQGLVHGDVTPANVLFTADGRPVLSDLGVARLLGVPHAGVAGTPGFLDPALARGEEPGPASDVHGLAATCLAALRGSPPYDEGGTLVEGSAGGPADGLGDGSRLAGVLVAALAPDPGARPRADELAAAVFEAVDALPVRVGPATLDMSEPHLVRPRASGPAPAAPLTRRVGAAPSRATPGQRRTRLGAHRARPPRLGGARRRLVLRRGTLLALLGVVALAMVVTTGLVVAADRSRGRVDGDRAPAGRAGGPWARTMAGLDAARSRAFAQADPARLAEVYAPGAPALGRDRSSLARLTSAGLRAEGLRLVAVAVAPVSAPVSAPGQDGSRVRLRVEDVMPSYRLVDATAALVESRPGRGRLRWTVTLQRVGSRWLVYDVERA